MGLKELKRKYEQMPIGELQRIKEVYTPNDIEPAVREIIERVFIDRKDELANFERELVDSELDRQKDLSATESEIKTHGSAFFGIHLAISVAIVIIVFAAELYGITTFSNISYVVFPTLLKDTIIRL